MNTRPYIRGVAAVLGCSLMVACTSIGSQLLPTYREGYNVALLRSEEEQLLLNIVRMQYGDRPYFMGVDSVTTSNTLSFGLTGGYNSSKTLAEPALPSVTNAWNLLFSSPSPNYMETPTLSYRPLQGEVFTSQMLRPISLERIYLLLESDWSIARVMRITMQHLGDLDNASGTTRPHTSHVPQKSYKTFITVAHLIRRLEIDGLVDIEGGKFQGHFAILVKAKKGYARHPQVQKMFSLLHLKNVNGSFLISELPIPSTQTPVLLVRTRSFLSMLYYLSKSVEVTPEQIQKGIVVVPKDAKGRIFDWHQVTQGMMNIQSAHLCPRDASVSVLYRSRCFYIADNDSNSKETLAMIEQLFSLAAGEMNGPTPMLTIPVTR